MIIKSILFRFGLLVVTFEPLFAQSITYKCADESLAKLSDVSASAKYLTNDRRELDTACIIAAISNLKAAKNPATIPILLRFFDFRRPDDPSNTTLIHTQGPTNEIYPAVDAVASFNDQAVGDLRAAIADDQDGNAVIRSHAALAYVFISPNRKKAFQFVANVREGTTLPQVQTALTDLLKKITRLCSSDDKPECDAIAGGA